MDLVRSKLIYIAEPAGLGDLHFPEVRIRKGSKPTPKYSLITKTIHFFPFSWGNMNSKKVGSAQKEKTRVLFHFPSFRHPEKHNVKQLIQNMDEHEFIRKDLGSCILDGAFEIECRQLQAGVKGNKFNAAELCSSCCKMYLYLYLCIFHCICASRSEGK